MTVPREGVEEVKNECSGKDTPEGTGIINLM